MDAAIEALIDLQAQGRFAAIYHSMADEDIERFLAYPHTMINSDGDLAVTRKSTITREPTAPFLGCCQPMCEHAVC